MCYMYARICLCLYVLYNNTQHVCMCVYVCVCVCNLQEYLDLSLCPLVWKRLAGQQPTEADILAMDKATYDFIQSLRTPGKTVEVCVCV